MSLVIHNTLTNRKEEFVPIEKGKVRMYVCGVTVYDDIHMGHARSMIVFDMVAKYLRYSGYEVTHVTNFTDVDDKIITRAAEKGMEPLELSEMYIKKYFEETKKLGIGKADIYPRASESMDDIIQMCKEIIDNGYGYVTPDGSVYFSVEKAKSFGCLTNKTMDDMLSTGRIANDEQKKNPLDFAVWKAAKPGEISWNSPWGKGRPGWHIECSAMIRHYLGDKIDIHGGGNDLIFPHHENEILQTEAVTGGQLANYWMHNGMLQVKGRGMSKEEKMSKSLGNFFRVCDVAEKYDSHVIRFYFLGTHYMSPLVYSEEGFELASSSLKRIWNYYRELQAYARDADGSDDASELIESTKSAFGNEMDDDFNTPGAIKVFFDLVSSGNKMIADRILSRKGAEDIIKMMKEFDTVFGILPDDEKSDEGMDSVMKILMDIRSELRKRKMYDLADMIRDRLTESGIQLEDSADGMKWKRI